MPYSPRGVAKKRREGRTGVSETTTSPERSHAQGMAAHQRAPAALPGRSTFAADFETVLLGALRLSDVAIVVLAGVFAFWLRYGATELPPNPYLVAIAIAALLMANYAHFAHIYRLPALRRVLAGYGALATAWLGVAVTLVAIAYLTKSSDFYSRLWFVMWVALALVTLFLLRLAIADQVRTWMHEGKLTRNLVIVGAGEHGQKLVERLALHPDPSLRVLGLFDDRHTRVPPEVLGVPLRGTVNDLLLFARRHRVDEIIIALPWRAGAHLIELLSRLRSVPADVKLCPEIFDLEVPAIGFSAVAGLPLLNVFERPLGGWSHVVKAIEDRALAVLLFVLALPLNLAIALAIKLDSPGPVLFRQTRYGFNNEEFTVLKFRTMRDDAPATSATADELRQATRADARVTRVGAFLRRSSLDELPQLYNVLRGEMSLVGPRPHAVPHNQQYAALIGGYLGRHRVKPGMTGWAQVHGLRGETSSPERMRRRVEYDIYYIEHWSLWLDLKILVLTLFVGFVNENAY